MWLEVIVERAEIGLVNTGLKFINTLLFLPSVVIGRNSKTRVELSQLCLSSTNPEISACSLEPEPP